MAKQAYSGRFEAYYTAQCKQPVKCNPEFCGKILWTAEEPLQRGRLNREQQGRKDGLLDMGRI